jgi:hypothetical protein
MMSLEWHVVLLRRHHSNPTSSQTTTPCAKKWKDWNVCALNLTPNRPLISAWFDISCRYAEFKVAGPWCKAMAQNIDNRTTFVGGI